MMIRLYLSPAGNLWLAPEGRGVMILMEPLSDFRADARAYGEGWTEEDLPAYTVPLNLTRLEHVATYDDPTLTIYGKPRNPAKGYLGIGIGNRIWNAILHRGHQK